MKSSLTEYTNSRNELLKGSYASMDVEYKVNYENNSKPYTIYAVSIVNSDGGMQTKHIMDFQNHSEPEKGLLKWFVYELLKYRLTLGWYSKGVRIQKDNGSYEGKDSDLKVIDTVCKYYNVRSIIKFDRRGIPYISGYSLLHGEGLPRRYYHIDLYQIYKKPLVKSIIYQNRYQDLSLNSVCKAIIQEVKYENLDGLQIQKLSKEKQVKYVTQDAQLVMKLSKHDDYKILNLMNAISMITRVPFEKVCHTQISTWWKKIIQDRITNNDCRSPYLGIKKRKYSGGYVIEPKVGFYHNKSVHVLDVRSLYPSMMIAHNISFDTVNCECCKNNPHAKVGEEIMCLINSSLPEDEKRNEYWICKSPDYIGIVPRLIRNFRDERFRQQQKQNEVVQIALKNIINGCYGLFGSEFFEFSDYRVAELTTAYGRLTLKHMQDIAREVYDLNIIYGDTDSIFVTGVKKQNDILKFIAECSILYDIEIEESKIFDKFLITKKKHYIGIHQDLNKEPEIKGMEGIKSDRPSWINRIEKQFADDIKYSQDPTIKIREQFKKMELGHIALDELAVKVTLKKDPSEYVNNSVQRIVGSETDSKQGDTITYYKSNTLGGGTPRSDFLNRAKYLEMLKSTVEESLKIMGYDYLRDIIGYVELQDYTNLRPDNSNVHVQSTPRWVNSKNIEYFDLDIRSLIRCQTTNSDGYTYVPCTPAKGVLYVTDDNPCFISGQIRMRGKNEGRYPYNYLDMIDTIFGNEKNTIEVCSRSVPGINRGNYCFTVDINPICNPDLVGDGETLKGIENNRFNRWRCDPPYSKEAAEKMYHTSLPKTGSLLKAGARVCKPGSLMFLLLSNNYQPCPSGVKRIGMITISVIPNNELRILNIFYKFK